MKTKRLSEVLARIESWPAQAQNELAEIALDIDAGLKDVVYEPTPAELEGIDRGLRDAEQGRFVTEAEVEAMFAKFRRNAWPTAVMPALVAGIHAFEQQPLKKQDADGRDKPGHDEVDRLVGKGADAPSAPARPHRRSAVITFGTR